MRQSLPRDFGRAQRFNEVKRGAAYQAGSIAWIDKNAATEVAYGIPAFGRVMSALFPTTLEVAKRIIAKVKAAAAMAKLAFLRMGASDFGPWKINGPILLG